LPRLWLLVACGVPAAAGCDTESPVEAETQPPPPALATAFDPGHCGAVTGRVVWSGPIPETPPFLYGIPKADGSFDTHLIPNPNKPDVDPTSRAVAGAVVFLRGVNPAVSKPWDLPPVRIELKNRDVAVVQGDQARRVGFLRRGDAVSIASAEPLFHVLRGRGAAFFSLALPDPDRPQGRTFDTPGRVELSSGAGYYWATANLFVDEHPYYVVTDRDGRFVLGRVPAGAVEVVVWLPGWTVARQERDPESGLITRQSYGPPVEVKFAATVGVGRPTELAITVP
jgi:hypothetical protein